MRKVVKILSIIIILVIIFLSGRCEYDNICSTRTERKVIRIACVGDSNTFRHGGSYADKYKYSYYLSKLFGDNCEVRNYGEIAACVNPNGNCPYIDQRVFDASIESEKDILIVMLGTNDIWEENWVSADAFKKEYIKLINSYMESLDESEIYLCTIPRLITNNEDHINHSFEISDIIIEISKEYDLNLIDINTLTLNHKEWYESDGIHFNKDGAKGIANYIYKAINENIKVNEE